MSTSMGPDDPNDARRIGRGEPGYTEDAPYIDQANGVDTANPTDSVEGRVVRREVITPATTDPITVRGADTERRPGPCWNRIVGGTLGAIYLIGGVAGFFLDHPAGTDFAGRHGSKLFGLFEVNNLLSVVHLVIGAVLVLGALAGHAAARSANLLVALAYLVVGVVGIFAQDSDLNVLALNGADHGLHLGTAALLGLTALIDRRPYDEIVGTHRARSV